MNLSTYTRSLTLASAMLTGCAGWQSAPTDTLASLPVVRVGDTPPQSGEYVVFYPAGQSIPVKLDMKGSLFEASRNLKTEAILSKDVYLYQYWASHDSKSWRPSHELLGVDFGGGLDIQGLTVHVKLDTKSDD